MIGPCYAPWSEAWHLLKVGAYPPGVLGERREMFTLQRNGFQVLKTRLSCTGAYVEARLALRFTYSSKGQRRNL